MSAIPNNFTVVEWLNGTIVSVTSSESWVLLENTLNNGELLLSHSKRILHHEVQHSLCARRSSQGAFIGEVLAMEGFLEFPEINSALDLRLLIFGGWGPVPIDVVQEPVREASIGLQIELNGYKEKIIQARGAFLLVDNVEFHLVVAILLWGSIDGVF